MAPDRAPPPGLLRLARPRAWPSPARRAALAALAVALAWVLAHSLANRAATQARIRARAEAALRQRLPGAELGPEVSVDWLFRATVGPVIVPAAAEGAPPVLRVERIKVRASFPALLAGRAEPASVKLFDVVVAPGPGGKELTALADRLRSRQRPAAPAAEGGANGGGDPVLHVRRLVIVLPGDRRIGPLDALLSRERDGEAEVVQAWLGLEGGGTVDGELRRRRPTVEATVEATATATATPTATSTSTATPTSTPTPTSTSTATATPTSTSTSTATATPTSTSTSTATATPTSTPTSTATATATATATPTATTPPAWTLTLSLHATSSDLPDFLRRRAIQASGGDLTLTADATATPTGATGTLRGALAGLTLTGEPLGPEPVGPLTMSGEAEVTWHQQDRAVTVVKAALRPAGPLAIELRGRMAAAGDLPFELEVRVPPIGYRALLEALPAALVPGPDAPRPEATFGARVTASGALSRPSAWVVAGALDLAGMREAAREAVRKGPPGPLRAAFTARPAGEAGPAILVGPENPAFVPVAELPEHVVRAVTTSEDAGFFGHEGFDFDELKNAAVAGLAAGQLQRGGSTITQQLAKNLFLSRDRTLARKAREALLTVALEGTVPKARLLEIYLNVIEWGPGLHGLGPAARHYFDVDARALSPRQACFLAAIVPSPLRSHAAVAAGRPPSLWSNRIDDLLLKLQQANVLTEEQLQAALDEPLVFRGHEVAAGGAGDDATDPLEDEPPTLDQPGAPGAAEPPEAGSGG